MMDRIGLTIGNYRVTEKLQSGSFGAVYKAQHRFLTDRIVAIKFLHAHYIHSQQEQALFMQEAQAQGRLKHPGILSILDCGIHEDCPYIIMEFATKGSLSDRLNNKTLPPLTEQEILRILTQIGQALHYIHQKNIVHRDLKPANILFNEQGEALLADFGIAVIMNTLKTHTVGMAGTPDYIAPEQVQERASIKSDQYALGCIAYELFTGQRVFHADNVHALMFKHVYEAPIPPTMHQPHLAPSIEQAILKALAKQPKDRHPDISTFINALSPLPAPPLVPTHDPIKKISQPPPTVGDILDGRFYIAQQIESGYSYSESGKGGYSRSYVAQSVVNHSVSYSMIELDSMPILKSHRSPAEISQIAQTIVQGIKLFSQFKHPGLPSFVAAFEYEYEYDSSTVGSLYYLLTEYRNGSTLQEMLDRTSGPLAEAQVIAWMIQCCDIVIYLRSIPSQHPHLIGNFSYLPENFIVTNDRKIQIRIDNVFRKSALNVIQQGMLRKLDSNDIALDDICEIGAMAYHLLTRDNSLDRALGIVTEPLRMRDKNQNLHVVRLQHDEICPIEQVIAKAIRRDDKRKFQSIHALRAAFAHCLSLINNTP